MTITIDQRIAHHQSQSPLSNRLLVTERPLPSLTNWRLTMAISHWPTIITHHDSWLPLWYDSSNHHYSSWSKTIVSDHGWPMIKICSLKLIFHRISLSTIRLQHSWCLQLAPLLKSYSWIPNWLPTAPNHQRRTLTSRLIHLHFQPGKCNATAPLGSPAVLPTEAMSRSTCGSTGGWVDCDWLPWFE